MARGVLGVIDAALPFIMVVLLFALELLVRFIQAYVLAILTCIHLNDGTRGTEDLFPWISSYTSALTACSGLDATRFFASLCSGLSNVAQGKVIALRNHCKVSLVKRKHRRAMPDGHDRRPR
jgi:hypothetical protein